MPAKNNLTELKLKHLKPGPKAQVLSDGGGLYIKVYPNGRLQWLLRKTSQGRAVQVCLGDYPAISLKDARAAAAAEAARFTDGRLGVRRTRPLAIRELFDDWLPLQGIRDSSRAVYSRYFKYLHPLHNRTIDTVTPLELKALATVITAEHGPAPGRESARLMACLERHAYALGLVETPRLQLYSALLPPQKAPEHRRSIEPARLPELFERCAMAKDSHQKKYLPWLALLLLTMSRANEIAALKWEWIDLDALVITWPGDAMKTGKVHRVPICPQLASVLSKLGPADSGPVLTAVRSNRPIQRHGINKAFSRLGILPLMSPHGIRSLGRSWIADQGYDFVAAEYCLAHQTENSTQRAYQRTDYLEQRRAIMQAWGDFVETAARPYLPTMFSRL